MYRTSFSVGNQIHDVCGLFLFFFFGCVFFWFVKEVEAPPVKIKPNCKLFEGRKKGSATVGWLVRSNPADIYNLWVLPMSSETYSAYYLQCGHWKPFATTTAEDIF